MHDLSLKDRTLAALAAADLASEEVDLPLRARRREAIARIALVSADVVAVATSLTVVSAFSLDAGATFYVCGDAKQMAKDVRATLVRAFADVKALSPAAAEASVAALERDKRYQQDVY